MYYFNESLAIALVFGDTCNSNNNCMVIINSTRKCYTEADADKAGGQGHFEYNLFRNNCEHFATWCVTGRKLSLQERKFTMVFWMFLKSGFYDISDEFVHRK
jgi:hypothetical protein